MPRKKAVEKALAEVMTAMKVEPSETLEESEAKKAYRVLMDEYAQKNPEKYKAKLQEFLDKLNSL